MEGGVENDDVGQAFENALRGTQAQEVGGVVQGGERDAFFDAGNDFVVNEDGFAVQFAAADDAVADGADAAVEAVGFEFFHQGFDRAGVVGLGGQVDFVFFAVCFECDVGIGQVKFFGKAAQQDFAAAVIQDRAFEGRAAAVQNQD
ncbi:hypothetical protein NEILACOT_04014 [Neisseria lactamica ATCC 23970]|uniref:Uncharacterized protein n=1 Tax=Neisseria lactamica ATCC 23970 TaxID=546265 RepID=D0W909_NEILA|nr:hypothetical protein NEILACOT_04014 [Neisseria lactamica ATCC 23970]